MTTATFDSRLATSSSLLRRLATLVFATDAGWGATALRLILGLVIFPHGAQKLFGWFGGYGVTGTLGYFQSLGIPTFFGALAIAAETLGALALILGLGTRLAALGVATNFAVAALMVHLQFGFFMNWFGNQKGEGVEYLIIGIALAATVIVLGGGRFSIDRRLTR
ncbi:MAG TPA: DoxX family protein [Thermoanaerobaculia bacterium]|nr:DoxX family protein [Thermoanaerobaculia bacterium]